MRAAGLCLPKDEGKLWDGLKEIATISWAGAALVGGWPAREARGKEQNGG